MSAFSRWSALLPGGGALLALGAMVTAAILALLGHGSGSSISEVLADPYIRRVTLFTLMQAGLSTILSVLFAIPVARALHRRRFPGRDLLIRLFGLTLVIPVIVAVLGIVAVHGRTGWVNDILSAGGMEGGYYLFGLSGILIGHVFFNMPLVVRTLLNALDAIPPESWRLASHLGMSGRDMFRIIEWPALRAAIPGIAGVVLMLCFTSFAIVLTLGGGPRATTLEVAIYEALRFDFDLPRAVFLALIQMILCGAVAGALLSLGRMPEILPGGQTSTPRPRPTGRASLILDLLVLLSALLLVLPPLAAILLEGVRGGLGGVLMQSGLWAALFTSLSIALSAGVIATLTGLALLISSRHLRLRFGRHRLGQGMELAGSIVLVVPPFVLVTGLFILLRGVTDVFGKAQLLVILVNACMALPFAIRVIGPACLQSGLAHDRLCQSLSLRGLDRLRLVDWPALRRPGGLALAYATTLSLGDFGVVAIFGSQDFTTLPLFIYRLMGAYKLGEAAAASLVLILLCFLIFVVIERLVGGRDA